MRTEGSRESTPSDRAPSTPCSAQDDGWNYWIVRNPACALGPASIAEVEGQPPDVPGVAADFLMCRFNEVRYSIAAEPAAIVRNEA